MSLPLNLGKQPKNSVFVLLDIIKVVEWLNEYHIILHDGMFQKRNNNGGRCDTSLTWDVYNILLASYMIKTI